MIVPLSSNNPTKPPLYPQFDILDLSSKTLIEDYVRPFEPYSDYNFTSLWAYNISNTVSYSFLYDNLIIKFSDYISSEPFYSFLGTNHITETINQLLAKSTNEHLDEKLKLIPEIVVS